MKHQPIYQNNTVFVQIKLAVAMYIRVELINVLGQNLGVVHNERHLPGDYMIDLNPQQKKYSAGQYIYRIITNGKAYSKSVVFVK